MRLTGFWLAIKIAKGSRDRVAYALQDERASGMPFVRLRTEPDRAGDVLGRQCLPGCRRGSITQRSVRFRMNPYRGRRFTTGRRNGTATRTLKFAKAKQRSANSRTTTGTRKDGCRGSRATPILDIGCGSGQFLVLLWRSAVTIGHRASIWTEPRSRSRSPSVWTRTARQWVNSCNDHRTATV